jgi:tetratricopeptide (TPR) repeat protein
VASFRQVKDYRNTKKNYQEIGRELKVKTVLDAAVQRLGKQIKITPQLIDASTGRAIWAPIPYKRDAEDIELLQGEVIEAIIREIRVKLTPQEKARLDASKIASKKVDLRAYDLYLRAKKTLSDLAVDPSSERWQAAYKYIQQAIGIDPNFAATYWLLSDYYGCGYAFSFLSYKDAVGKADAALEKGLSLDPDSAEAHKATGKLKSYKWDWEGAKKELERAAELAPGDPEARVAYSYVILALGQFEEAIAGLKRAIQIDPSIDPYGIMLAEWYGNSRRYDEAITLFLESIQSDPNNPRLYNSLSWVYASKGMYAEAVAAAEKSLEKLRAPDKTFFHLNVAMVYAFAGRRTDALKLLDEYLTSQKGKPVESFIIAEVYSLLGEKDKAFEWLDRAIQDHAYMTIWLKIDKPLDNIRSNPRFKEYLKKAGFEK